MKEKKEIVVSLEEWRALCKDEEKINEIKENGWSVVIEPKNEEERKMCWLIKFFLGE